MKIVHICISNPYIDGWGYQENLLTQYLQKNDTQNYIIASANNFPVYLSSKKIDEIKLKGNDYNNEGIFIKRIKTKRISTSFLVPFGLRRTLEEIKPDVIFHHNFNCTSMPVAAHYAKTCGIPMMVDNHADSINMTKNRLWVFVYYKILIGLAARLHKNDIYKAYGVTHSRCDFIHDYYGLSKEKIDFLPIGADVDLAETIDSVDKLRHKYNIGDDDFVVASGGKMGAEKGTDRLIDVVEELHHDFPQIKLLLFGSFEDTATEQYAKNSQTTIVHGWCDRIKTLELLKLANVACWPIHHTTLVEDAISVCTPLIIRKTGTTEHLIDGNGIWIESTSKEALKDAIRKIICQNELQKSRIALGCTNMKQTISYHAIAKKVLYDVDRAKEGK